MVQDIPEEILRYRLAAIAVAIRLACLATEEERRNLALVLAWMASPSATRH
jgi:hypothetical protein